MMRKDDVTSGPSAPVSQEPSSQPSLWRKKPVEVEAWQFTGQDRWEWPSWLKTHPTAATQVDWPEDESLTHIKYATHWISIGTLEGVMRADLGDWIIKGVKGELYPCKPDIFAATYEPARSARTGSTPSQGGGEDLRRAIASAIVDVANRWLAPNFPPSFKLRSFDDLDERGTRLHLEYADAVLAVVTKALPANTATGAEGSEVTNSLSLEGREKP